MPLLTLGGATLRYDRAGAGPTVLLIHGWLGNRSFWERQITALRDRFTVVTVDLRGHGESSPPRTGYTIGGMAADLEQLVRAIGAQKVAVVGWSMGGMIAQSLAIDHPKRLRRLVLMATAPGDGHATFPDAAALTALSTGDAAALLPDLFPPDQVLVNEWSNVIREPHIGGPTLKQVYDDMQRLIGEVESWIENEVARLGNPLSERESARR